MTSCGVFITSRISKLEGNDTVPVARNYIALSLLWFTLRTWSILRHQVIVWQSLGLLNVPIQRIVCTSAYTLYPEMSLLVAWKSESTNLSHRLYVYYVNWNGYHRLMIFEHTSDTIVRWFVDRLDEKNVWGRVSKSPTCVVTHPFALIDYIAAWLRQITPSQVQDITGLVPFNHCDIWLIIHTHLF